MRRVALYATVALATLAGIWLLWELREGLLLLVLSLAAAASLRPAVRTLVRHKVPLAVALAVVYGASLIVCGALVFTVGGPLMAEAKHSADDLVRVYERLQAASPSGVGLSGMLMRYLPPATGLYGSMVGGAWGATVGLVGLVGRGAIVVALAIYWTVDQEAFESRALALFPVDARRSAKALWRSMEAAVGARVRSEMAQSLFALLVLGVCFHALGLRYPMLPAGVAAVTRFVPMVGAPLAVLAAFGAGALTSSALAMAGAACAVMVTLVLTFAVGPRFAAAGRRSSLLQVVLMLVLLDAYGLAGLMAAAPLAAALDVLGRELAHRVAVGNIRQR
jgi:predicted PurR-regulated permease PerM